MKRERHVILCVFLIVALYTLFPGAVFCEEEPSETVILERQYGKLSDISSEPAYIWLLYLGEVERIPWVYNVTSFQGPQEEELSPREFLMRYKGSPVIVFTGEGKAVTLMPSIE